VIASRAGGRATLAAALASLALALGACGDEGNSTSTAAGSGDAPATEHDARTPKVAIQSSVEGFDAQQVYADSAPGVVTILAVLGDPDTPIAEAQAGQGSGFVLNEDGEIVTNAHVVTDAAESGAQSGPIQEASQLYVEFSDRNQVPADIIGFDPNADVALIKVDPEGLDLQPVKLGDSDSIEVGQPVAAIGSPFGEEQSLSVGIISATDRSIDSLTQFKIDGAIQTDASINPGNSGGPLIGADGGVIGIDQQINTTSGGNEGVGFAVPINLVKRSIEDLRDDGKAEYAYIGVKSQALYPQLAEKLGIDAPTGSLISKVIPDGPADEAGLQGRAGGEDSKVEFQGREVVTGGDVITAVDGDELVAENDLSRLIAAHQPGDKVTLSIIRDGEDMDVEVTLGTRPSA
jgi:S1-C subfamily serine protease